SVGRGTDAPFEQLGANWIQGQELAQFLNNRAIPGVRVYPTRFQKLEGVRFVILNRELFSAVRLGLELAYALNRLYPGKLDLEKCRLLIGNRATIDAIRAGTDPSTIEQHLAEDLAAFADRRQPFLLY